MSASFGDGIEVEELFEKGSKRRSERNDPIDNSLKNDDFPNYELMAAGEFLEIEHNIGALPFIPQYVHSSMSGSI